MDNLDIYARQFDELFPTYVDQRYQEIRHLLESYDVPEAREFVQSDVFSRAARLVAPLAAIKNYKSQIPFPEDLAPVVTCIIEIRTTEVTPNAMESHGPLLHRLLSLQGFQLPTASAVMHFCRPNCFPIVDRNVEAACCLLQERFPEDFALLATPKLPGPNTSAQNKTVKYLDFIAFINKVVELQRSYGDSPDYRYVDRALMVLGSTTPPAA